MVSDSGIIDGTSVITAKDAPRPHPVTSISSTISSTSTSTNTSDSDAVVVAAQDNNNNEKKKSSSSSKSFRLVRYLSDLPNWQTYNDNDEHFIQEMPKIELHVHLDGSFDPDFLWRYMQQHPNSIMECLPCETILPWEQNDENGKSKTLPVRQLVQDCQSNKDYHKLCTCRGYRSLKQMLNCFEIFLPLVRRNLSLLEQLAFDFVQRQYEQNVVYTEVRYSPFLLAEGFTVDNDKNKKADNVNDVVDGAAVLQAITSGLRRGFYKFNIIVNQILCAITWRPDWAQPTLDLVYQHYHDYPCATVGIDIATGEEHFDAQNYAHLYQGHYQVFTKKAQSSNCKYKNIPVTIHAGESPDESSSNNVRRAVEEYGASRIGHGYRIVNDIALMEQLRRDKIHLEVCPTSSDETGGWVYDPSPLSPNDEDDDDGHDNDDDGDNGKSSKNNGKKPWKQHPIVKMSKAGLSFSLNSDDPAVFHTSLSWQYRVAMVKMGFTREQLLQCNLNAIDAAFCSPEEKEKLKRHLLDFAAFTGLEYVPVSNTASSATTTTTSTDTTGMCRRRRKSTSTSTTGGSIHRAHHTDATTDSSTPPQWKRSMSANFVDRVYVYKPGAADKAKEYEYL